MADREHRGGRPRILALWSAPRSRSTAFARMFTERGDYMALHEPFSHIKDFGEVRVGEVVVHAEDELICAIRRLARDTPLFFKDTTDFHYPGLLADAAFLADAAHTFIIRHPAEAIASHYALNPALGRDEVGFAWLAEIYDAVAAATGRLPVVIDSDDLVEHPHDTVRAYCEAVGIPFIPRALSWAPGMLAAWQQTSRWHEATSSTGGFTRGAGPGARPAPENQLLAGYVEYHLPFYNKLRQAALQP